MALDVLLIGSGGREHALAWKIKQSSRLGKLYIAPGNAGTEKVGENVPIPATDFDALAKFAIEKKIGLTVVGPDDPLALGIVDYFTRTGLRIFGPSKAAAQIEASKAFAKRLMQEVKIPTAEYKVFTVYDEARAYVAYKGAPIVVKASGLALGKGAYVCQTMEEAEAALEEIMVQKVHKDAGNEVVIEEYLVGPEISIHAISDGINYTLFPSAQDHKRAGEGDTGKNTGGMGTVAPVPLVAPETMRDIELKIVRPTLEALAYRGTPFRGVLYPGIIMTVDGPKVLEFNARFGDPETQVYMRLLISDVLDLLEASVDSTIGSVRPDWQIGSACNIVLASQGYPDAYQKGYPINGVEDAEKMQSIVVFHAGTIDSAGLKTNGGRVLGVSATGVDLKEALARAYQAADKITFEGKYLRRDIGNVWLEGDKHRTST